MSECYRSLCKHLQPLVNREQFSVCASALLHPDPVLYQSQALSGVSRTFALTIPQLPAELATVVTHAYLLLRLADTIEDEPALTPGQIRFYENAFLEVVSGRQDARQFSDQVCALLTEQTQETERALMHHLPWLMQVDRHLNAVQREALLDCLRVMTHGMSEFRVGLGLEGLKTRHDLDRLCYCVSGVVGEMLTEFFIDFDPSLSIKRATLQRLSVSFGAALQLTNILKDQWEDRARGVCWLPQDLFAEHGVQLCSLNPDQTDVRFDCALSELIGTAHAHLRQAFQYLLLIPSKLPGIRRFIAWTLGLALMTLRKVHANPGFGSESQVRVSHAEVFLIMRSVRCAQRSDRALSVLFKLASQGLPFTPLSAQWQETAWLANPWPRHSIPFLEQPLK